MRGLGLLVALLAVSPAAAELDGSAALEEAIATYTRALDTPGRDQRRQTFRRAELLFTRSIEEAGASPELYTNLGNAALQAERLGPAVLAYRRALALDPSAARALQNLEYVRTLLPEWVPRPESAGLFDTFFFWHRSLSRGDRTLGAALGFAAAALLVAASIRFGQGALRGAALVPGLCWLALLVSLWLDPAERLREEGVIVAPETVARGADSALAPSALPAPLPGGAEVRILERRSPWLRVRLANGRDAWVAESSVGIVAESHEGLDSDSAG
ncbi:MAG: hypothetical protein QNK04_12095 [Myxococcota bacterium]|nr:hypothetical protein [Myxococcota bacterium]